MLRELFAALGIDPFVIAECLARPALAERLVTGWYGHDETIHGDLKQRAEAELQAYSTVDQMKQTSGTYREIEVAKTDSTNEESTSRAVNGAKLNNDEWSKILHQLAATFNKSTGITASEFTQRRHAGNFEASSEQEFIRLADADKSADSEGTATKAYAAIPTGKISSLQEYEEGYYAVAVINKSDDRVRLATVRWRKEPVESWLGRVEAQLPPAMAAPSGSYTLPVISAGTAGCVDNTWAPSSMNLPIGTWNHTAVWTGSEMIVWGGENLIRIFATGGKYNPGTDTWVAISIINAPSPRTSHTAVWTGSEMIIWGGSNDSSVLNTGRRYNPSTNSWTATSTTNAPTARSGHTAVWTGTQMIVWGGSNNSGYLTSGGRYNPNTNTWTATSTTNTPAGRFDHTAVWTGTQMIVWGGWVVPYTHSLNTGGRYNPVTNSWTATSTTNAPIGRHRHTAVWTGTQMIVWGGLHDDTFAHDSLNTGGRYNPVSNSWTATSATNVPAGRYGHTAIWTGADMIIWGGASDTLDIRNTGAKYHPATNNWTATSTTNAPATRSSHTAVWTGSEMIVWGGAGYHAYSNALSTGGRYHPSTNTWSTTNGNAPTDRQFHTAVWTGTEMIVWGGEDDNTGNVEGYTRSGGRYHPSTDSWISTSIANAPSARADHTSVWSGNEMIVWGGFDGFHGVNTGARYNPGTNTWVATSTANAPTGRSGHTAVWAGNQMLVWGGSDADQNTFNTGSRYRPSTNTWSAMSTTNAPTARLGHTAVWTGTQLVIWGGTNSHYSQYYNTGGRYNLNSNTWAATSTTNAPSPRKNHTAVWTGAQMIIWGGDNGNSPYNTGGRYNPSTNIWTATSTTNAPTVRGVHGAVWTGREMIVWGGDPDYSAYGTGGRYNPDMNSWSATSTTNAATGRSWHTIVWTGDNMLVWGGFSNLFGPVGSGGIYCAQ